MHLRSVPRTPALLPAAVLLSTLAPLAGCELTERTGIGFETPLDAGPLPTPDADVLPPDAAFTPTVTYHDDIRPIIEARCLDCHDGDGIGTLDLRFHPQDWSGGPAWWVAAAADAMLAGRMPPWMPEDGCRPIANDRRLTDDELARVEQWRAERYPVGSPRGEGPTPPVDSAGPDRLLASEGYVPDFGAGDDHRCLVVGEPLAERLFVAAIEVRPEQAPMVRRARVYAVPPDQAEALAALDADDPGPGYACYGGPGAVGAELVTAWQPGDGPLAWPPTSAVVLDAGTRLVLQLQYDPAGLGAGAVVPVDHSAVALWLRPGDDPPADRVRVVRHAAATVRVPAGAVATSANDFVIGRASTVVGVVPQMQAFGAAIEAAVVHPDGASACLVRIEDWQFDRQRAYVFPPEQWVAVEAGDVHRVRCAYDNRDGDTEVGPGDGPADEACVDHLITTVPYATTPR